MHKENQRKIRRGYWMSSAVLILGIISSVLLFWVYRIAERQAMTFEQIDVIQDIHIRTASFHLWFEEAITKGAREEMEKTFANLNAAMQLSEALCCGGKSEHGTIIVPFGDPAFRQRAESISTLLVRFRELARKRSQNPGDAGIGSALDEQFNAVFSEFQENAWALELTAEKSLLSSHARTRRLLLGTAFLWAFIIAGSCIGLYIWERRHKGAALALEGAYGEMEQRVALRTAELADANNQLRGEIAERKKAEEGLRESESEARRLSRQFYTLLDAIPDSITLLSPEMRIIWENRGSVTGGKGAEAAGQLAHPRRFGTAAPCNGCPVARSFATGKVECCQRTVDGRTYDVKAFPLGSEDGPVESVLEIAADVTENLTLQAEKMRAAHLASIGELAAGVAHEINNPINGIINYARMLANKSSAGGMENDVAERIVKEGRRIAGIVNSLLAFARDKKEAKRPVRVADILRESLTLTEAQIRKKGIKLRLDLPADLPEIIANQQQIQQVVINIINNAQYALEQKYTGEDADKILDINGAEIATEAGPFVRLSFRDHGIGIIPDVMGKIMNPFFSTKPVGEGTGLGLSISHGIVGDHGGRIDVKSAPGKFTMVLVDLPAKMEIRQ